MIELAMITYGIHEYQTAQNVTDWHDSYLASDWRWLFMCKRCILCISLSSLLKQVRSVDRSLHTLWIHFCQWTN